MPPDRARRLTPVEGRHVSVALSDGSRIDDCQLVSAGRHHARSLWLFTGGQDTFVPLDDVVDLWEYRPPARRLMARSRSGDRRSTPPSRRSPRTSTGSSAPTRSPSSCARRWRSERRC